MHSPADEDLMLQVRNGNLTRLGELFERYQTPLFQFHLRMTGHRQLSEDLVQEVFLRILRYRHTYRPGSAFTTWMYQIARNVRADSFRRRPAEVEPDAILDVAKDRSALPDQEQQSKQEEALVRAALARLDEDKRELLLLSRFQGLKYEQIAELLNCEPGAVKVRMFRAIRELREIYAALTQQPRLESKGREAASEM